MSLPSQAERAAIRKREQKATPGPWCFNSYSNITAVPLHESSEAGPDYPAGPRPGSKDGTFFTPEDNAWLAQRHAAYEADCMVAWVPAEYGDTSTGRHYADADFIEHARTDVPMLLDALDEAERQLDRCFDAYQAAIAQRDRYRIALEGIRTCEQHGCTRCYRLVIDALDALPAGDAEAGQA